MCWNSSGITALGTGSLGSASNQFYAPYHLVIVSSSTFYVADAGNQRVQKFTSGSMFGSTIAGQGSGASGSTAMYLNNPAYIIVDSSGNLYVADSANHRVQYFVNGSLVGVTVAGTGKFSISSVLNLYCRDLS